MAHWPFVLVARNFQLIFYLSQAVYSKLSWHKVLPDENIRACLASVEGHRQMGQPPAVGPQLKEPLYPYFFVPVHHIHIIFCFPYKEITRAKAS
jgi:hypothetical protein